MYEYNRETKKGKVKKVLSAFILMLMSSIVSIMVYSLYINTPVWSYENIQHSPSASRMSITMEDEEQGVYMLENAIEAVVRNFSNTRYGI